MSSHVAIRRRILEALDYPRQVAMANVDLSACPHSGFFKSMDTTCSRCAKNYECDWLNSTDEFSDLAGKPMEFLYRALTFGIDYVDACNSVENHETNSCECDTCDWLREARLLVREYAEVSISA